MLSLHRSKDQTNSYNTYTSDGPKLSHKNNPLLITSNRFKGVTGVPNAQWSQSKTKLPTPGMYRKGNWRKPTTNTTT